VISPELLEILGCPLEEGRPPLEQRGDYLVCTSCGAGYRIEAGIPNLLPEDAIPAEKMKEVLNAQ
jgi:uncharacterized protein YbaR (Trm112 family)